MPSRGVERGPPAATTRHFGPIQPIRCELEGLSASSEAFGIMWANPLYDVDKTLSNSKRVEFALLRHSWQWAARGAVLLWAIYNHHITDYAPFFFIQLLQLKVNDCDRC